MATEATVTIKVKPTEFDLMRQALTFAKDSALQQMKDNSNYGSPEHQAARELAGQYTDLLRKLS